MSYTCDVIKIHINEGTRKLKIHDQSKLGVRNRVSDIFPLEYDKKQGPGDSEFHRRLWAGQEIDRGSKMKIHDHFYKHD